MQSKSPSLVANLQQQKATHRLEHFVEEIVALTRALADAGKHREATVGGCDVVDELHDEHRLADTGTAEEANLTATSIGGKQVYDLDASDQDFLVDTLLIEQWGVAVNGQKFRGVCDDASVN